MALCGDCEKDMREANDSCTKNGLKADETGEEVLRNTIYFDCNERCHDCNILNKPGNIHHRGCDMERCPKCGFQLISCGCFELMVTIDIEEPKRNERAMNG